MLLATILPSTVDENNHVILVINKVQPRSHGVIAVNAICSISAKSFNANFVNANRDDNVSFSTIVQSTNLIEVWLNDL